MLCPCPQHQSASTAVIPTGKPRILFTLSIREGRIAVDGSWHHFKFIHHSEKDSFP